MKRILFVDDEESVLGGLENLLRKQRKRWKMAFALGGQAALVELGKNTFDVIVSDMRMPGMDGATLLQKVKEQYPAMVRIVLSGHAEREAMLRALPVAHQFLAKPCDADILRVVIERTCDLKTLLNDGSIRDIVGKLDRLPSVPSAYWKLMEAMTSATVEFPDIVSIVEKDPAMSAKILQLVNSAYFGFSQEVTSISQAVKYLGIELIKGLTLTVHLFFSARQIDGFSLDWFQFSSLATARLAKSFLSKTSKEEDAFTAGILHDVGKVVIALGMAERFSETVKLARSAEKTPPQAEAELFGVGHGEVGGYLLGMWGLPFSIVETVSYHHSPSRVSEGDCQVLAAVHVADALVSCSSAAAEAGEPKLPLERWLDFAFLEKANLSSQLPLWQELAEKELSLLQKKQ